MPTDKEIAVPIAFLRLKLMQYPSNINRWFNRSLEKKHDQQEGALNPDLNGLLP